MQNIANKAARKAAARNNGKAPAPANNAPAPGGIAAPAGGWPAAHNGAAWLALIAAMPAIAAARAGKYKGSALNVNCANVVYSLTATGALYGAHGKGKSGRYTVAALTAHAHKLAQAATGSKTVCGAAIVYFALCPAAPVLALLQPPHCRTAVYVGKPLQGKVNTPCPAWLSGYVTGHVNNVQPLFAVAQG